MKYNFAIDLTWVRHNKVGGVESSIRNLLDGFMEINSDFNILLLTSKDNTNTFEKYSNDKRFKVYTCDIVSYNQKKRVLWQNFKMGTLLKHKKINICLEPIYSKPFLGVKGITFYTTIHDLQALHYPEYFSRLRNIWMRMSWWWTIQTSKKVIAISNFVKNDILQHYSIEKKNIVVIYDAISIEPDSIAPIQDLNIYNVKPKKYYYTVSSLLPHKNLSTIIKAMSLLKKRQSEKFYPLIISGVGGKSKDMLVQLIKAENLNNDVIITEYVDDPHRNLLYKNCIKFLFPSIFEGFGMPPLEAMAFGVPVLTTSYTSIYEVTCGLAEYVSNGKNIKEWAKKIEEKVKAPSQENVKYLLSRYNKRKIAETYLNLFKEV